METPAMVGRYRIERRLGAGRVGVVLAAHDPELDRTVAVKLLHEAGAADQRRLLREAQTLARVRHPNVVTVHDTGISDGRVFVAMELIDGTTLAAWLAAAPRPWREIVARFVAAGRGLAAAHAVDLAHGDFKADNVLVDAGGAVRVTDFGLSSIAPPSDGGAIGDPASDQAAFAAATRDALRDRGAPGWVDAALRRAGATDPAARFPSMTALLAELERGLGRRRRVLTVAIAAAALAATAITAVMIASGRGHGAGPQCRLAAAEVATAWNPEARARVTATFGASQRPHAAATLDRVLAVLDRHAAALGAARVAACEATHVDHAQSAGALDRRMACVDQRVASLAALVGLFGRAPDDAVIDRAFEAASALPDATDCTGPTAGGAPVPPAAIQAQVATLQHRLIETQAQLAAGQVPAATAALETLAADARALGYAPLTAQVLDARARGIKERGDPVAGLAAWEEAATAAGIAGDDRLIALAAIGKINLLATEGGKPADAGKLLAFAEVAVTRAGGASLHEAFLIVRSDVEEQLGDKEAARRDLEAAGASYAARGAARTMPAGLATIRLATMLFETGHPDDALVLERDALAMFTEILGPEHPKVAQILNNIAIALDENGRYEEALPLLERSLAIKEHNLGHDHPSVAYAFNNLGMVYNHLGRNAEAITANEQALAIREKALGPDHPMVASSLSNLAVLRRQAGNLEAALAYHTRALAIREKINGPDHPSLAFTLTGLATTLKDLHRPADALAAIDRAIAIRIKALGPDNEHLGDSHALRGDILREAGRPREACAAFAEAIRITEKHHGADHPDLAQQLVAQAVCRLDRADIDGAIADASRALTIATAAKSAPFQQGAAHFVLARALWTRPADRARAHGEAEAARALYGDAPTFERFSIRDIEQWIASHPSP